MPDIMQTRSYRVTLPGGALPFIWELDEKMRAQLNFYPADGRRKGDNRFMLTARDGHNIYSRDREAFMKQACKVDDTSYVEFNQAYSRGLFFGGSHSLWIEADKREGLGGENKDLWQLTIRAGTFGKANLVERIFAIVQHALEQRHGPSEPGQRPNNSHPSSRHQPA